MADLSPLRRRMIGKRPVRPPCLERHSRLSCRGGVSHVVSDGDSHVTVERLEILSGVDRRRRWSGADKERLVGETLEPGVTVTEVARRHDLDRGLLYRWRQELGVIRNTEPVGFLPVEVAIDTDTARPEACTGPGGMEIALPDGVRVRVDRTVDVDALSRVLRALGRR